MTFTVLLLYKKISQPLQSFRDALEYLIRSDSPHIILGDFNINHESERSMLTIFSDNIQVVDKPTHLRGALLDHVYVKKAVLKQFTVTCSVLNIYFSDHDDIQLEISAEDVDFHTEESGTSN